MSSELLLAGTELRHFVSDALGNIIHEHRAENSACFGNTPVDCYKRGHADVLLRVYIGFSSC